METKKPLESVGWLGGSSNYTVINEAARREASMKPWSVRIPAAIADGEKLLGGDEYVLIPLSLERDDTNITFVLTAGELAMATALWLTWFEDAEGTDEHWFASDSPYGPNVLREFTLKMESLSNE